METQIKISDTGVTTFTTIYSTYYKKMYTYGIAIGFCEHLCKDAVQDVFCTIFNSKKSLDYVDNVESYLLHCMKNRLFDIYKERKKINCICHDNVIIDQEEDSMGKIINEENQEIIKKQIDRLLKKLESKQRKIVYCRFHHNLKFNEIGGLMDMSPDAVKKLLYRTLKTMRRESEAYSMGYSCFF